MGKYRPRTAPNLLTVQKIRDLAAYRERNRDQWGRPPVFLPACRKFHIDYRTVQRHAQELREKWDDPEFHW